MGVSHTHLQTHRHKHTYKYTQTSLPPQCPSALHILPPECPRTLPEPLRNEKSTTVPKKFCGGSSLWARPGDSDGQDGVLAQQRPSGSTRRQVGIDTMAARTGQSPACLTPRNLRWWLMKASLASKEMSGAPKLFLDL